jgi:Protein of unknown function (DUF1360)
VNGLKNFAVRQRIKANERAYQHGHDQPLEGYTAALALFAGGFLATAGLAALLGRKPPERFRIADIVLGGLATHKFARIVAKDAVLSPVRVPFTRFEEPIGAAEVSEEVRDHGPVRKAFGELISCPFCLAPWVASAYIGTLVLAPRAARAWSATFTCVAISDLAQHAYARVRTG